MTLLLPYYTEFGFWGLCGVCCVFWVLVLVAVSRGTITARAGDPVASAFPCLPLAMPYLHLLSKSYDLLAGFTDETLELFLHLHCCAECSNDDHPRCLLSQAGQFPFEAHQERAANLTLCGFRCP